MQPILFVIPSYGHLRKRRADLLKALRDEQVLDAWRYQMSDNPLKLKRIDHVEFYTGNAKQAAYYYRQAFGFSQFAYSGLETGVQDASSYALRQGKANFVFTNPLSIEHLRPSM